MGSGVEGVTLSFGFRELGLRVRIMFGSGGQGSGCGSFCIENV